MRHSALGLLVLLAACSTHRNTDVEPRAAMPAQTEAANLGMLNAPVAALDECRIARRERDELRAQNAQLLARLADSQSEVEQLYDRLMEEQKLRREAELSFKAAQADIDAATTLRKSADSLRARLAETEAELASTREELKNRREELMRIILEQQEWNKYVLDRLRPKE